eukprot:238822-Amphidinium_carterae.2
MLISCALISRPRLNCVSQLLTAKRIYKILPTVNYQGQFGVRPGAVVGECELYNVIPNVQAATRSKSPR